MMDRGGGIEDAVAVRSAKAMRGLYRMQEACTSRGEASGATTEVEVSQQLGFAGHTGPGVQAALAACSCSLR